MKNLSVNSGATQATERAVNKAIDRTTLHIVTNLDMDRNLAPQGHAPVEDPNGPIVVVDQQPWDSGPDLVALCGFVVSDEQGTYGSAATFRALRAEPSHFEVEPMCGACIRAFSIEAITDGQRIEEKERK